MFGSNNHGINAYTSIGIETGVAAASPHKLITLLYEGAITACLNAVAHMRENDIIAKGEALSKAIMIIENGLRISLDMKAGGDIALSLDALYDYMSNRLFTANLKNQAEPVAEVIKLLHELKGAWESIANATPASAASAYAAPEQLKTAEYYSPALART
ncbi:MAG: flagellar export chaperone FliS [Methylophilaceae bacterium]